MGKNTVIICGPASSGKTTAAKTIAKAFGLKFYDGGDILKLLAKDLGYNVSGKNWWDSKQAMEFFKLRQSDASFDKRVDEKFNKILDNGNCVVTSWTMPWLYKGDATRIWISASLAERAKRMSQRDKIDIERAKEIVKDRDRINYEHYKRLYGISFGVDFKPFDILIDTSKSKKSDVSTTLAKDLSKILRRVPKGL